MGKLKNIAARAAFLIKTLNISILFAAMFAENYALTLP